MISMTAKIRAMSAVAHHLNTDLTSERAKRNQGRDGLKFTWWCCEGGNHIVRAGEWFFAVDLVLDSVALRVGVMPRRQT